ncbi:MAG: glycosyltransferase family 4 protein, partial [Chloroflexi bacterium]|nr:glycosyltransferase family 4 protein [Chloroflexota bacterium]
AEYRVHWQSPSGGRRGPLGALYAAVRQRLRDRYLGAVVKRSDRVLTLSYHSASLLSAWLPGIPRDRVLPLPGGVDVNRFRPAPDRAAVRRRLGLPASGPILLTVRRLAPRMGLEDLLVACASLADLAPCLVIVGQGPLARSLQRSAETLGIDERTRFAGVVAPENLPDYYQAADLFVLPTLTLEAFGLVTLEALACGTPVVATRAGANPELLDPLDPELLVPVSDPAALAQALRGLLQRGPALEAFRAMCRAYVENSFSWERTAQSLVQHCQAILAGSKNR